MGIMDQVNLHETREHITKLFPVKSSAESRSILTRDKLVSHQRCRLVVAVSEQRWEV